MIKADKFFFLRLFIAAVFIFSGIVKLFPIIAFEFQLINRGITEWFAVIALARLLIGLEIFIGLGFLQRSYLKKIFIPLSLFLLLVYSLDLIKTIIISGWSGNCGCFGQIIVLTPLEALIKNFILAAALVYLYKNVKDEKKGSVALQAALLVVSVVPVFLIFPPRKFEIVKGDGSDEKAAFHSTQPERNENQHESILNKNLDSANKNSLPEQIKNSSWKSLFAIKDFKGERNADISKGERIVAFLSLGCESCIRAASVLDTAGRQIKLPKVYYLFLGDESEVSNFFKETKTSFPYKILDDITFISYIKKSPPRIILFNDGRVVKEWNEGNFNSAALKNAVLK